MSEVLSRPDGDLPVLPDVDVLAGGLRGDASAIAWALRCLPLQLLRAAAHHGVLPLVVEQLNNRNDAPPGWLAPLHAAARAEVVSDLEMEVYAPASSAPLFVLYARRLVRGARRWLSR